MKKINLGAVRREITLPNAIFCFMLGMLWMFVWVTFQSPTNLPLELGEENWIIPARFVSLLSLALSSAVLLVRRRKNYRKDHRLKRRVKYAICIVLGLSLFLLDIFDGTFDGDFSGFPFFGACLLWGVAGALVYAEFGQIFSLFGAQRFRFCVVCCIVSVVCMLPLQIASWYLGGAFRETIILAFVIAFYPLLGFVKKAYALKELPAERETRIPVKFVLTLVVLGAALGIMQGIFTAFNATIPGKSDLNPLSALGFVIASVSCMIAVFSFRMDFNRLLYQVGFPLIAIGFLVVSIGGNPFFGYLFSAAGYRFTELSLWILCIYLAVQIRGVSRWLFALLCCATAFGQAFGLGFVDSGFMPFQREICMVVSAGLLLCSLFFITSKSPYESWGIIRPGVRQENKLLETACDLVAVEEFFTPRERDVFILLAQGHNRKAVSERLVLSENTIKTHMANIYQKLGIHTQQELIDGIELRRKDLERQGMELNINNPS